MYWLQLDLEKVKEVLKDEYKMTDFVLSLFFEDQEEERKKFLEEKWVELYQKEEWSKVYTEENWSKMLESN